jgi:hypothetical protein
MNSLFLGIVYLVAIAFLITLFFSYFIKRRGPWGSSWTFFAVVLLAVFAADLWIGSVGPYFYESVYWIPPLVVGLVIATLLAATTPSPKIRSELELQKDEFAKGQETKLALGTFFWFLFVIMLLIVIVGLFKSN